MKYSSLIRTAVLAVLATVSLPFAVQADDKPKNYIKGNLKEADYDRRVFTIAADRSHTPRVIAWTDHTKFRQKHQTVSYAEMLPGDKLEVEFRLIAGKRVAKRVNILASYNSVTPAPQTPPVAEKPVAAIR